MCDASAAAPWDADVNACEFVPALKEGLRDCHTSHIMSVTSHHCMSLDEANHWMQQTFVGGWSSEKVASKCDAITWHNSCVTCTPGNVTKLMKAHQ